MPMLPTSVELERSRVGKAWTKEEREMLKELAHLQYTAHQLSLTLGRSRGAVQQKAIELGLTLRASAPAPRAPRPTRAGL